MGITMKIIKVKAQAKMVAMPLRRKSEEKTPPSLKELKAIMDLLEAISAEVKLLFHIENSSIKPFIYSPSEDSPILIVSKGDISRGIPE